MKPETLDKLVWIAIFAGLLLGGFGLSLRSSSENIGWVVVGIGAALIAVGIGLIVLRSRHGDER